MRMSRSANMVPVPHFINFSNFAYKKRKHFILDSEKENCMEKPSNDTKDSTPIKVHREIIIPETPASLLPSPSGHIIDDQSSPQRVSLAVKKRKQFARIDSSDDEESSHVSTHIYKRRKLSDSFGDRENAGCSAIDSAIESQADGETSPILRITRKYTTKQKSTRRDFSDDSDNDFPSFSTALHDNVQSLYPCSSREKLQQFAFRKGKNNSKTKNKKLLSHNVDGIQNNISSRRKKVICITDSESCSPSPPPTEEQSLLPLTSEPTEVRANDSEVVVDALDEEFSGTESEDDGYSNKQKKAILEFINSCSVDELCGVPGCSVNKARIIDKCRPFETWELLVDTVVSKKGLNEQVLEGCQTLLEERKVLERLLAKCKTISTAIHDRFSQLQNTEDVATSDVRVYSEQPQVMNPSVQLKPYQLLGLNWLVLLHSQDLNGILADEMGLGKTIQAISFLSHLYQEGSSGHLLVVVPSSTIDNWVREFNVWCPAMTVITYWGSQQDRAHTRHEILSNPNDFDTILTTYNVCIGQLEDRKFFRKLSLDCLVLDEGHMLKNMNSQRFTHLMKIKVVLDQTTSIKYKCLIEDNLMFDLNQTSIKFLQAKRRVLLTGTPLQNNLLELMSLLSFVMPQVFQQFSTQIKKTFSRARKVDESSAYYREQVAQAKQIMQPFTLRRLKSEVLSQLPAKVSTTEHCQLTEAQGMLYQMVVERSLKVVQSPGNSELVSRGLDVMMELRKAANHPLLLRGHYTEATLQAMSEAILREPTHRDANPALVFEDMTVMSDFELHNLCIKFKSLSDYVLPESLIGASGKCEYLARKLSELKKNGDRVLVFSQFTVMLDILEVFLQQKDHTYLRLDGQTPVTERQRLIDQFNDNDNIFLFLLSTRAGGLGINLTSANVVIIHDIDFNPYNDKQAEDRCHRVGQTRDVRVIRLVSGNTVEEDILLCAQSKLKLEQDLTTSSDSDEKLDVTSLLQKVLTRTSLNTS